MLNVGKPLFGGTFAVEDGSSLPFVLPGETVCEEGKNPTHTSVVTASPDRVLPGCVHFGRCGGCQYQHAAYPAQVLIKQTVLLQLLQQTGIPLPTPVPHAAQPWEYRNRLRLRVETENGTFQVGYSRRGSKEFLPIRMCPISAPLLWRTVEKIVALAVENPFTARWLLATSELELFCTPAQDRLQLQFLMRQPTRDSSTAAQFGSFCEGLQTLLPELTGASATLHPDLPRRTRLGWDGATWGAPGLLYPADGRNYWVSRGAFFQVNRFLVDTLIHLVTKDQHGKLAWDLYAGVGLFTRALAASFPQVIAVEGSPEAAADLARLAHSEPTYPEHVIHARRQATLDFLRGAVHQRERPDLVVLDPPRAGLGAEGASLLAQIAPPTIVYVSCDPTTLVRDLRILFAGGYSAEEIHLVDLFPQTAHLETVILLRRSVV